MGPHFNFKTCLPSQAGGIECSRRVFFGKTELRGSMSISDIGVKEGSVLTLVCVVMLRALTAAYDTAMVWSAVSGKCLLTLMLSGVVTTAVFSADGQQVLTASKDRTAKVWSATSGECLLTRGHCNFVNSADGQQLLTSCDDVGDFWKMPVHVERARPLGHNCSVLRRRPAGTDCSQRCHGKLPAHLAWSKQCSSLCSLLGSWRGSRACSPWIVTIAASFLRPCRLTPSVCRLLPGTGPRRWGRLPPESACSPCMVTAKQFAVQSCSPWTVTIAAPLLRALFFVKKGTWGNCDFSLFLCTPR